MGIWDDLSAVLDKSSAAVGRFADATSLKFKCGEEERKRHELAAQLGESLYEMVRANPALAAGREQILEGMARCDEELARIKAEMERIAVEEQRMKTSSVSYACPACGSALAPQARFCQVCGTPLAPIEPPRQEPEQACAYTQAAAQSPFETVDSSRQEPAQPQQPEAASPFGAQTYESPFGGNSSEVR